MIDAFCAFEDVLANHGRFLPLASRVAAASYMETALLQLNCLHCGALEKGEFLWHITPKSPHGDSLGLRLCCRGGQPPQGDLLRRRGYGWTCQEDRPAMPRRDSRHQGVGSVCHIGWNEVVDQPRTIARHPSDIAHGWWTSLALLRGIRVT